MRLENRQALGGSMWVKLAENWLRARAPDA